MKQSETKAISLGESDAAVLLECSNDPRQPIPRLTIYNEQFAESDCVFPATSARVCGQSVHSLYKMLHEYYLSVPISQPEPVWCNWKQSPKGKGCTDYFVCGKRKCEQCRWNAEKFAQIEEMAQNREGEAR